jgi:hypothetical protein
MKFQRLFEVSTFAQVLFSLPAASQNTLDFQYPTGNETYNILDTIIVQWTSNYETPILFTWVWDAGTDEGEQGASKGPKPPKLSRSSADYSSQFPKSVT